MKYTPLANCAAVAQTVFFFFPHADAKFFVLVFFLSHMSAFFRRVPR